jgi:hypothetical protein
MELSFKENQLLPMNVQAGTKIAQYCYSTHGTVFGKQTVGQLIEHVSNFHSTKMFVEKIHVLGQLNVVRIFILSFIIYIVY